MHLHQGPDPIADMVVMDLPRGYLRKWGACGYRSLRLPKWDSSKLATNETGEFVRAMKTN